MKGDTRSFYSRVVGVTRGNRQAVIRKCRKREQLQLIREPDNSADKNAVIVARASGEQLGYLSRDLAEEIAPRLDKGWRVDCSIANITGGGWFSSKARGVNIQITKYLQR